MAPETRTDVALRRLFDAMRAELEEARSFFQDGRDVLARMRDRGVVDGFTADPRGWVQAAEGLVSSIDEKLEQLTELQERVISRDITRRPVTRPVPIIQQPSRALIEASRPGKNGDGA